MVNKNNYPAQRFLSFLAKIPIFEQNLDVWPKSFIKICSCFGRFLGQFKTSITDK